VVIGTPGRVSDVSSAKRGLRLEDVSFLVLDECDAALDLGFFETVRALVDRCRPGDERQTAAFTATTTDRVERLLLGDHGVLGSNPIRIEVGRDSEIPPVFVATADGPVSTAGARRAANPRVTQIFSVVEDDGDAATGWLVENVPELVDRGEVLVFVDRRRRVDDVATALSQRAGVKIATLHGEMAHFERARNVRAFREGEAHGLVATDLAARGLDVPNVRTVISAWAPKTLEQHAHRVGRTGRGVTEKDTRDCVAYTLVPRRFLGSCSGFDVLSAAAADAERAGHAVRPEVQAVLQARGREGSRVERSGDPGGRRDADGGGGTRFGKRRRSVGAFSDPAPGTGAPGG
jgi:superfamily II DNA/RNA helicase